MIALIIKDISTQLKYLGLLLGLFVVFTIVPQFPGEMFLSMGIVMTAMRMAYLEEKNNTLALLKTMPLKASTIVWSKYLSEGIIALAFGLIAGTVHLLGYGEEGGLLIISILLPSMLVFVGIYYAMFFKVGYIKASSYIRIIFFAVFIPLLFPPVTELLTNIFGPLDFTGPTTVVQGVAISSIFIAICFITSLISIWFLQHRENF